MSAIGQKRKFVNCILSMRRRFYEWLLPPISRPATVREIVSAIGQEQFCSPSSRRMAGVPTEQTERTTTASQLCCTAQRRDHLQAIVEFPRGKLLSNLRYAIVLPYNFLVSIPSFRVILTASFRFLIVGAMRRQTASEACWYPDRRRQTHWNCNWCVWRRCPSHGNSG